MRLLGGVNKRITERKGEERKGHEEEISKEEVKVAFKKIKEGKATGIDRIPGEALKYGGKRQWSEFGFSATEYGRGKVGQKSGKRG